MQENFFETLWGRKSFTIYYQINCFLLLRSLPQLPHFFFFFRCDYALVMTKSHPNPFQCSAPHMNLPSLGCPCSPQSALSWGRECKNLFCQSAPEKANKSFLLHYWSCRNYPTISCTTIRQLSCVGLSPGIPGTSYSLQYLF